jgi:hypothetical protein
MTAMTVNAAAASPSAITRGALVAAELFTAFHRWLTTPARPRGMSRAEEAAAVRELAYSLQATDPGLASDLFGAAARHESLDD